MRWRRRRVPFRYRFLGHETTLAFCTRRMLCAYDHYVESGSFINDHAVEKPVMITLTGMIGELVYTAPEAGSLEATLSNLSTKLGLVPAYLGPFTPGMTQKLSVVASAAAYAASQATAIEKRATNLIRYFKGEDSSQSLQEKAFRDLSALWKSKQVVTVQTPWGFFGNMMIKTISPKQDQQSNDYTDFSITLKEVRFVDIKVTTFDSGSYQAAIDAQNAPAANIGPTQGEAKDWSKVKSGLFQTAEGLNLLP